MKMVDVSQDQSGGGERSGGLFFKLADGEAAEVTFAGEFIDFWQHFGGEGGKSLVCVGARNGCPKCAERGPDDRGPSRRFRVAAIQREGGGLHPKIWDMSKTLYNQLFELNADYPLESHWFKVKRTGSGTDTTYTIMPTRNPALAPSEQKAIAGMKLPEIVPQAPNVTQLRAANDDSIPF